MRPILRRLARSPAAFLLALLLLAGLVPPGILAPAHAEEQADEPAVFYVATDGRDAWSGRLGRPRADAADGPFRTLVRARDAARALGVERACRIELLAGTYELDEPLLLGPEDSGTAKAPRVWTAHGDGAVILSGGRRLENWTIHEDGRWSTSLPPVAAGTWTFRQLFLKPGSGEPFRRRYRPARGMFRVAGLTDAPARTGMRHRQSQDEFLYHPEDLDPWANLEDVEVVVLHDWSASRLRIRELDESAHVVRFTGYPIYRVGHWFPEGRNPYFVENVKEALSRPGEWYLDRSTGVLTYLPMEGETASASAFVAPRLPNLVELRGVPAEDRLVEHVHFVGIEFRHTSWALPPEGYSSGQGMIDLPAAFDARGAARCRVEGCTFANLGAYALAFSDGSRHNEIVGNRMFDLGGGGVRVGGGEGVPVANRVENNVITDGGLVHYSAHGVWAGITDGTVIRHNEVRRFAYTTVSVGWKWDDSETACRANVVEYNHIHEAMLLLADGGGIYTLGLQPGTVLRGNYIHDVRRSPFAGRAPNNGIFFDQGSKAFLVAQNAIHDCAGQPVRFHQTRRENFTWEGNVLGKAPSRDLVARAGLEPAFRHLLERLPAPSRRPVLELEP